MAEFSLGSAELGTEVNLDGLDQGIADAEAKSRSGFASIGDIIGGALKVGIAAAAAVVVGFGAIVAGGVADARAAALTMAQTENVIRSTGGAAERSAEQVADLAASLSAAAGKSLFGDDQIQAAENLLLTFTNIKGEVFDAATAISVDMAQALGGEPQSQAIALGKALNDPIAGVTALSRVGVSFTDQQKEQIRVMQEAGDMAGAQQIILAELNKEFGGSAEAAARADGGWAQFQDRLGEAQETIGAAVLPILTELTGFLIDNVLPVIEDAAQAFSDWLSDPAVQAGIREVADLVVNGLGTAFDFITNEAIPALLSAWELIEPAVGLIAGLLAGDLATSLDQTGVDFLAIGATVQAVMDGIMAVVGAVLEQVAVFWAAHGEEITAFAQEAWGQIAEIINLAVELINATVVPALQGIAQFISDHGAEIQLIIGGVWNAISSLISGVLGTIEGLIRTALAIVKGDWAGAWEEIKGVVDTQITAAKGVLDGVLNAIAGIFGTTLDTIVGNVSDKFDEIVGNVSDKVGEVVRTIEALPGKVAGVGEALVNTIWDGIKAKWGELVDWFNDELQKLRDTLPFSEPKDASSPLRGLGKSGQALILNILEGMLSAMPDLLSALSGLGEDIVGQAEDIARSVGDVFDDMFTSGLGGRSDLSRARADTIDELSQFQSDLDEILSDPERSLDAFSRGVLETNARALEQQLAALAEQAEELALTDPERAAAFYEERKQQLFELADLNQQFALAETQEERDRLAARMRLIEEAQRAELALLEHQEDAQDEAQQDQLTGLGEQLAALLDPALWENIQIPDVLLELAALFGTAPGAPVWLPAPAPMGAHLMGGGMGLLAQGGTGGTTIQIETLDARGATADVEASLRRALTELGITADIFIRTRRT